MINSIVNIFKKPTPDPKVEELMKQVESKLHIDITFSEVIDQNLKETVKTIHLSDETKDIYPGLKGRKIDYKKYNKGLLAIFTLKSGQSFPRHRHPEGEALWIIDGSMIETESGENLKRYDSLYIPGNKIHAVTAITDCTYFLIWENLS